MAGIQTGGIYGGNTPASEAYQANLDMLASREAARKASSMNTIIGGLTNAYNMSNNNVMPNPNIYSGAGTSAQTSSGGTSSFAPPPQMSAPPPNQTLAPPDTSAATAASFAKAKDQVGQESRSALTGLKGAMAGRGILGSGVEGRGIAGVINKGQGELGDVSREQAITGANLAQKNAELAYQGSITQRGQDIGQNEAAYSGGIAQRGQDIGAATTQRGQDISLRESEANRQSEFQLEQQRLAAQQASQRQNALMGLLGNMNFNFSY
jgi:hypothetical protein